LTPQGSDLRAMLLVRRTVGVGALWHRSNRYHHNLLWRQQTSCQGCTGDLTSAATGLGQVFCNVSRKAIVSRCNWATVFCSLRFSAWRNASRLIGRQPDLPRLSCKLDSTFAVFNTLIMLMAVPLYVWTQPSWAWTRALRPGRRPSQPDS
jgi:hypothetical protein